MKLGLTLRLELGLMLGDAALYGRLGIAPQTGGFFGLSPTTDRRESGQPCQIQEILHGTLGHSAATIAVMW